MSLCFTEGETEVERGSVWVSGLPPLKGGMGVPTALHSPKPGHDDQATITVIVTMAGQPHAPLLPAARRASLNCHGDPARQGRYCSGVPKDKTEAQGHGAAEQSDSTCTLPRRALWPHAMNETLGVADLGLGPPNPTLPKDWSTNCITFHGLPAHS